MLSFKDDLPTWDQVYYSAFTKMVNIFATWTETRPGRGSAAGAGAGRPGGAGNGGGTGAGAGVDSVGTTYPYGITGTECPSGYVRDRFNPTCTGATTGSCSGCRDGE